MSRLDLFLATLKQHAERPCIQSDDSSHTYANLLNEIQVWQSRLKTLKVNPGDVVALQAEYSASAIAALLAMFTCHAVAALIPDSKNVSAYLRDARAASFLKLSIDGSYTWDMLSRPQNHPLLDWLRVSHEGGIVLFTSGLTGTPKATLHSLERFMYKLEISRGRALRTIAFMLFDHVAGLDTLLYTLRNGGTLILPRRRDRNSILGLIESYKAEVLPTSPSFLRILCAVPPGSAYDLTSLKIITHGSEPMDPTTLSRVQRCFPTVKILQKYGTTETGSPRTESRNDDSLWLKIKRNGVEIRIVDDVLWIRSESNLLGYLNAPSTLSQDGWYCTGDLVDVDGEWIRFRGRANGVINVGGRKVTPAEVEQTILELEFVKAAVVSGKPHSLVGQTVHARIELVPSFNPKDANRGIRLHCQQRLESYKVPITIEITTESLCGVRQKKKR